MDGIYIEPFLGWGDNIITREGLHEIISQDERGGEEAYLHGGDGRWCQYGTPYSLSPTLP